MKKILIIGGVACGAKTASRLSRISSDTEITILERGSDLSYANCGFPFYIGDEIKDASGLIQTGFGVARDSSYFEDYVGAKALTGHEAIEIDREKKSVAVKLISTGEVKNFPYDKLVIATGASPIRPDLPGINLKNVFTLWTLRDTLKVYDAILAEKKTGLKVTVVGAGLVGTETAEALKRRGADVVLLDALSRPLFALAGEEFGILIQKELERNGIKFYGCEKLMSLHGDTEVREVKTDKRSIEADMVIVSIGVRPNIDMARNAGLKIGARAISVNEHMQTSDPDIYAGGDCAETFNIITGKPAWQPMGSTANRHGRVIADNLAGMPSRFGGVEGTAIVRVFNWTLGKTGITSQEAKDAGFDPIEIITSNPDLPNFMPECNLTIMRLIADKRTGKILGMQTLGPGKIDKRLDIAVTAIKGGLTIEDMADTDLAYAPPFAAASDPVTHAANAMRNKLAGLVKCVAPQELKKRTDSGEKVLLLDVRTLNEVKKFGYVAGENLRIPLGEMRRRFKEVPRDRPVVIICKLGSRAWSAFSILSQAGYTNIEILEGGFSAWPYETCHLV